MLNAAVPVYAVEAPGGVSQRDTVNSASITSDLTSLEGVIADPQISARLREASPSSFEAASVFWRTVAEAGHLTARMRELLLLAMHASATALDEDAIERHVGRARSAGASDAEIIDVLITVVGVANHALYFSVPILEEELEAAGIPEASTAEPPPEYEAAKREFIAARGFWNPDRDRFMRLMPRYFKAVNRISTESWRNGPLTAKEREFVCIAIDCAVTHNYEPGLRQHIRNAVQLGATRDEILEIFQLAALLGLEGYVLGARALFGTGSADD
jgi:alkylhydroperoxidase/carboxymuconolactone decarboxylase family protein YurZ